MENKINKDAKKRTVMTMVDLFFCLTLAECGVVMLYMPVPKPVAAIFIIMGIIFAVENLVERESALNKMTVYIDMDGVLAKWRAATPEALMGKEHYINLEVELRIVSTILYLLKQGIDVKIMTCYMNGEAKEAKSEWLRKDAVGLDFVPVVFVPYGAKKSDFIVDRSRINILLDDYSLNLREWESAGNVAVKFKYSYADYENGRHGTWKDKPTVYSYQPGEKIARQLIQAGLNAAMLNNR